ncbi:hypothetical protein V6Z12_D01G142000 [Gossypium hirsutum]
MKYKISETNVVTNAFSKRSLLLVAMNVEVLRLEELRNQYKSDPYFGTIISKLEGSNKHEQLPYRLHDGYLFRGNCLCIFRKSLLQEQILRELHGNCLRGHFRRGKTMKLVVD